MTKSPKTTEKYSLSRSNFNYNLDTSAAIAVQLLVDESDFHFDRIFFCYFFHSYELLGLQHSMLILVAIEWNINIENYWLPLLLLTRVEC